MKWELDDNARSGLHYLVLGVVVIGALALANAGIDRLHAPLGPRDSFGHGYWLEDGDHRLIVSRTTRGERLAAGVLLAFAAATLVSAVLAIIGRSGSGILKRSALPMGRGIFILALLFFSYAAIKLPRREFVGFRDGHAILWERNELFGDLPWPGWGKRIKLIPLNDLAGFISSIQQLRDERVASWVLMVETDGTEVGIANSSPINRNDTLVLKFAEQRANALNTSLRP